MFPFGGTIEMRWDTDPDEADALAVWGGPSLRDMMACDISLETNGTQGMGMLWIGQTSVG